ncbi:MAG TPA: LysR family transcriptional regulator [Jatrophihabitans sp.]|jgi:molybdate transport repressor ModE-like protein|uniref:LysR family transcriptional regulator n=1 Tax=Jatrophihabitans sp. TaxID=1932789 RepID=UPI002E06631D|nr:LysR family transcriptional regulator [Jatrophihabitans sp.]
MSVELRQLRALVAVVDSGTFTDAAIELGVSQASVSRAVAALEDALGARVLRRTTRTVAPTGTGSAVVRHARRVLAEVDALTRAVTDSGSSLRVGYQWSALGRRTADVQRRWAAAHPGGRLDLVPSDTPTAGLVEGRADVAVVRRTIDDDRFDSRLVGTEARMAVISSDDPWARRRFVRLADFDGRVVAVNSRTGTTDARLWPGDRAPVELREIHGVERWLNSIAAGEAVGITAEATAHQHPREGVLYKPVLDAEPIAVRLAWWHDDPPAGLDALLSLILEAYNAGRRT